METTAWLIPLVSGVVGALIGTYGGTYFLHKMQERKINKVRKIAIKALNIFKEYALSKKTYDKASEQFNINLKVAEKRAVLVNLHKLGVPIYIPSNDIFNINNINFFERLVDKDEIEAMIQQIDKGYCDHLFFLDVESYFTSNLRINSIRNIGKKYVQEVLSKSEYDKTTNSIKHPENWSDNFSPGEINVILVFRIQLLNSKYFGTDNKAENNKISNLIKEIEVGIWDNYLFWEFEAYQNVIAQKDLAYTVSNQINTISKQTGINTTKNKAGNRK